MVPNNLNVVVVNASQTAGNVMDKTTVVIIQMRASVNQHMQVAPPVNFVHQWPLCVMVMGM